MLAVMCQRLPAVRTKISMTSPVGLCDIVMVTNVISQHAAQSSFLFNTFSENGVSKV